MMKEQAETRRVYVDLWAYETMLQKRRLVVEIPMDCTESDLKTFNSKQLSAWADEQAVDKDFEYHDIFDLDVLNRITVEGEVPEDIESDLVVTRREDGTFLVNPNEEWWWLAINGSSCAASKRLCREVPQVSPVPEELFGFITDEERETARRIHLRDPTAGISTSEFRETLPERIRTGQVRCIRPDKPEPPTEGPTTWHFGHQDSADSE